MRLAWRNIALLFALSLAACTAPAPQAVAPQTRADTATSATPAPTTTDPQPGSAQTGKATPANQPVQVDASCRTDADCTVKDVGNCCGYYPACVNVNSPTDPEGVKARCASQGMMGVCGFQDITACSCVAGRCAAAGGGKALLDAGK